MSIKYLIVLCFARIAQTQNQTKSKRKFIGYCPSIEYPDE